MNARERFHAVMNFEPCDRTLLWEFGYWAGALQHWYTEGLPKTHGIPDRFKTGEGIAGEAMPWPWLIDDPVPRDRDVHKHFGLDSGLSRIPAAYNFYPPFEWAALEDLGDTLIVQDENGIRKRIRKDRSSVPDFISWPVASRDDFERLKAERLQPRVEDRLPENWDKMIEDLRDRDYPLCMGGGHLGLYGTPRDLIGEENLLLMYYDDPQLVRDLLDHMTDLWITIFDRILQDVEVDCAILWEDMCYRNGPMISPEMVREFMVPGYKKMTSFLRENGVHIILLDTDGNCSELIQLFLEGGVTGLYPFEVQAGMDVVKVRQEFPKLQILGGLDKRNLALDRRAVEEELSYKLPFLLEGGGYVPTADHLITPEATWDNFQYYRRRIEELTFAHTYRR
jgi:uroporphyrinogen decarboxylase